jgi:dihydrolipoamide dehydrogenase
MSSKKVIIIGGGPGGYVAAIRASQLGAKVTLIEQDRVGGTCLNRGCIPTKALLHDAKLLRLLSGSSVFSSFFKRRFRPLKAMMDRKQKVVQEMVKGVELLLESQRVMVKKAHADLVGDHRVVLLDGEKEKEIIEADAMILAPGSKSKTLSNIIPDGEKIITSDEALEIKKVPKEMVIVGGGYIGVEFATLFNMLGTKVTIVEILENILPGLDGELVRNLRRISEKDGIKILTRSSIENISSQGDGLKVDIHTPQGIQEITVGNLLLSVGRIPNLDLDFPRVGIELSPEGIRINRRMETTIPGIYAVGDVTGGLLLAHVAMEGGVVAAENVMGFDRRMEKGLVPLCIFTYPEIASVGMTEKEARMGGEIKIGRFPFRSNPAALISGETDGLIKVIVSQGDKKILGVHIIGHDASLLVSIASTLMKQGIKASEFSGFLQAHPTTPEALREAFLDADGMAVHLPKPLRPKA